MRAFVGLPVLLFSVCVAVAEPRNEPFGMTAIKAPEGPLWNAWRRIGNDIRAQLPRQARCLVDSDHCNAAERLLRDVVKEAEAKRGRAKIEIANTRINAAIRYTTDEKQWAVADAWSVPLTVTGVGSIDTRLGDCEDYSIAKYVVLRLAGIAAADLRLVVVYDRVAREGHAVAAVRDGTRWLILDNRWNRLFETRELEQRFRPLFTLDADGVNMLGRPFRIDDRRKPAR